MHHALFDVISQIFFITTSVNSKLEIEQRYYTETSPGINVNSAYIKSFGLRINKAGNIVLVNGYIVFNAPGLNINDVITGLPFPSTLQCDFVVADYGNGETGVMKLQNGSVLMVASSIQPNMEYNTNFAYVSLNILLFRMQCIHNQVA
nr:MAG TPA: hypothetical protein [Bacteriophage sp.]